MDEKYILRWRYLFGIELRNEFDSLTEAEVALETLLKQYDEMRTNGSEPREMDYIKITWDNTIIRVYEFD